MNILVTGGYGLIGHNVVKRLMNRGHKISIIDNKTTYGIIPQSEIDYLMDERIKKIDFQMHYGTDIAHTVEVDYIV